MSNTPETEFNLEQHFLPAWAKQPPKANAYAHYEGGSERRAEGRHDRRDRPPRRPGPGGPRPAGGQRPGGDRSRPPRRDHRSGADRRHDERPAPPAVPLPEINVSFMSEEHGVDSLARQIRMTGRAYPLFEIAQIILQKPERHEVTFAVKKKADGTVVQPLFLCALDDTLWLAEDDAVRHALDKHFTTFYQPERTQMDPPKGTYTFVAQCGMSGVILGPPNYHDYQNQLRKLHAEQFARMPFDAFKARVRIVKDEATVKKWVEDQSWKTEFVCLNLPEPLKLPNREEVEKHFRQVHLPNIIKQVESHRTTGAASRNLRDRGLMRLLRQRWEEQRRFPLQVATVLSQQFATRGLQFFKVNKSVTHVAVARPLFLDLEATPVSDGIRRIVEFINSHPKCSHKQLLNALAPKPAGTPATPGEPGTAAVTAGEPAPGLTPEMAAVMTDLHWLVHQGHVIEFANGVLETAKKPLPRPPKPASAKSVQPAESSAETIAVAEAGTVSGEGAQSTSEDGAAEVPGPDVSAESVPAVEPAVVESPMSETEARPDVTPAA